MTGLADTSLFIAREQARPMAATPPEEIAVSVVTLAELRLGVLLGNDFQRANRLATLELAQQVEAIPIDGAVAGAWARLVAALRMAGRRMPLNDSWIAATALAHRMPVITQDSDYDDLPGLSVIRI